jgi:hypothetical protein
MCYMPHFSHPPRFDYFNDISENENCAISYILLLFTLLGPFFADYSDHAV